MYKMNQMRYMFRNSDKDLGCKGLLLLILYKEKKIKSVTEFQLWNLKTENDFDLKNKLKLC